MSKVINQYLQQHAEPEAALLANFPGDIGYIHGMVIPAYQESYDFVARLSDSTLLNSNLLVLVINQPQSDNNNAPQQKLLTEISHHYQQIWNHQHLSLFENSQQHILVVCRFDDQLRIPDKHGVGMARKIGADLITALHARKQIVNPWFFSTDADAELPNSYFSALPKSVSASALVLPFTHIQVSTASTETDQVHQLTQLYQLAMNYYIAGLNWAGSSYAYHSLGSALAFQLTAYCQVRGFPKRAAGEDFYLLNKLSKLNGVVSLDCAPIKIHARISERVPFGTGPKVKSLLNLTNPEQQYLYYHPTAFSQLKSCLASLSRMELTKDLTATEFNPEVLSALGALGFYPAVEKISNNCRSQKQFQRQINQWFDAFKTLKFIHHLRDNYYPNIPLLDAIKKAPFRVQ